MVVNPYFLLGYQTTSSFDLQPFCPLFCLIKFNTSPGGRVPLAVPSSVTKVSPPFPPATLNVHNHTRKSETVVPPLLKRSYLFHPRSSHTFVDVLPRMTSGS